MNEKRKEVNISYNLPSLLNDVNADYIERQTKVDKINVLNQYYLKLFQFLCKVAADVRDKETTTPEIIRSKIEQQLEADTYLFGYTFFLSSNTDYDYTWTYHLQKENKYVDFIHNACLFLLYVLKDIDFIHREYEVNNNVSLVFSDILEVTFIKTEPVAKTKLIWENFNQITRIQKGYYVAIKHETANIATKYVSFDVATHNEELKQLISFGMQMIDKSNTLQGSIVKKTTFEATTVH